MRRLTQGIFILVALCCGAAAPAASGTFIITAGGSAWADAGWCPPAACSTSAFGFISGGSPVLSDGKQVALFQNVLYSGFPIDRITMRIDGFTSDPGVNYINSVIVTSCDNAPSILTPASVSEYVWTPAFGRGTWEWIRPYCMSAGKPYSISIQ